MKRTIVIILMLLYLIPAIGINGTVHFCAGEIASVSFNGLGSDEKCVCGFESAKKDCCNDENFSFQLEDEQYKSPLFSFDIKKPSDFSPAPIIIAQISFDYTTPFVQKRIYYSLHPPDNVKTPLYILHQVFRI